MTIDKAKFQGVLDEISITESAMIALENTTHEADANDPFDSDFTAIHATIDDIRTWASGKILEAEQAQVMATFLGEMKVVFEKYSAKLEVGSSVDGYGVDWGNANPNVGVKFTATLNNVTAVKAIEKAVIVGSDLV